LIYLSGRLEWIFGGVAGEAAAQDLKGPFTLLAIQEPQRGTLMLSLRYMRWGVRVNCPRAIYPCSPSIPAIMRSTARALKRCAAIQALVFPLPIV
jgi:hypothetical protein